MKYSTSISLGIISGHRSSNYIFKVDPEDILDPGVETEECPMLLNLHDGIALQEDELETVGDGKTEYLKKHLETLRQIVRR